MEHHWPGVGDALRDIPNRKFQKCREFLHDLNVPDGFWETEEGVELRKQREEVEAVFAKARLA